MDIKLYSPHPVLKEFVLNISTVNAILPDSMHEVVTPYPPTPFQSLIFYCNHPISMGRVHDLSFTKQAITTLIGPQYSRVNIKVHQQLSSIRVDFAPGGLYRLLGIPSYELFDQGFDATAFFGKEMSALNERLLNTPSLEEGKFLIEKFLIGRASRLKESLPIDKALHLLFGHQGQMSMEKTAALSCLSLKQFERKCKERLGMNPKLYARILKFSNAYRLHEAFPHLTWTEIAYEAGYYDQMHMIRDFKNFAGTNPTNIELQLLATPLRMQKDLRF